MTVRGRDRLGFWIVFFLLVAFPGCQQRPTEKITLAGGSLAGAWSAISEGVTTALRREMPGAAVTHEVGLVRR